MENKKITIRIGDASDVPAIDHVMIQVVKNLTNKESFCPDDRSMISEHINSSGFTLVSCHNNKVIGFLIVRFPKDSEDNLGRDIDVSVEHLHCVAHMETVAILPEYVGNGLQRALLVKAQRILKEQGYTYSMATVYPQNYVSLNNFLKLGYEIKGTKKKYGGVDRHILQKIL